MRQNTVNTEVWSVLPDFYVLAKMGYFGLFWSICFTIVLPGVFKG